MLVTSAKTRFRLEYWKTIIFGDGVSFQLVPRQTFEYSAPYPLIDKMIESLKEHEFSYKIVEITERLVEQTWASE